MLLFQGIQTNERVFSLTNGWGTVKSVTTSLIGVSFDLDLNTKNSKILRYYNFNGLTSRADIYPSLLWDCPQGFKLGEFPKKPYYRAKKLHEYFYINTVGAICRNIDRRTTSDDNLYNSHNYFANENKAMQSKLYLFFYPIEKENN